MKQLSLLIFTVVFALHIDLNAQNVYIPDANFKAELLADFSINVNGDTAIQISEANNFNGSLFLDNAGIIDITGIEEFTSITFLTLMNNQISSIDVSNNTALEEFYIDENLLTSLDVSNLSNLFSFSCANNFISNLNVNGAVNMAYFWCNDNLLTQLDVSTNINLLEMNCTDNCIGSLDVSGFYFLERLYCSYNCLTNLNTTGNTELLTLTCSVNNLSNIDVFTNTSLNSFSCVLNHISSLDFTNNNQLSSIYCGSNELSSLKIHNGNNTAINSFSAINNPMLTCIEVDNVNHFNNFFTSNIDTIATFSNNCVTNYERVNFLKENGIKLWPNPSQSLLNIEIPSYLIDKPYLIMLGDNTGSTFYQYLNKAQNSGSILTIDVSHYSNGLYFVHLIYDNKQLHSLLMISHE